MQCDIVKPNPHTVPFTKGVLDFVAMPWSPATCSRIALQMADRCANPIAKLGSNSQMLTHTELCGCVSVPREGFLSFLIGGLAIRRQKDFSSYYLLTMEPVEGQG